MCGFLATVGDGKFLCAHSKSILKGWTYKQFVNSCSLSWSDFQFLQMRSGNLRPAVQAESGLNSKGGVIFCEVVKLLKYSIYVCV